MADLSAIRAGLAAALATITGLRTFAYIPDSLAVPAAVVGAPAITFDTTMQRGCDTYRIPVRVYVTRASERMAQAQLDAYFETGVGSTRLVDEYEVYVVGSDGSFVVTDVTPASVKAAIEADPTLGGVAMSTRVTRASGYGVYTIAGVDVLGAEWSVEVIAAGRA